MVETKEEGGCACVCAKGRKKDKAVGVERSELGAERAKMGGGGLGKVS